MVKAVTRNLIWVWSFPLPSISFHPLFFPSLFAASKWPSNPIKSFGRALLDLQRERTTIAVTRHILA